MLSTLCIVCREGEKKERAEDLILHFYLDFNTPCMVNVPAVGRCDVVLREKIEGVKE